MFCGTQHHVPKYSIGLEHILGVQSSELNICPVSAWGQNLMGKRKCHLRALSLSHKWFNSLPHNPDF